ncbi:unnamed protein product [Coregonus sp. 'balchen']|nr:unnamed protein product [Coregonus sp. 'balchen']
MTFEAGSRVTLLFDFWVVHRPAGMVLSVFVVILLAVFYELLKVWKVQLGKTLEQPTQPAFPLPLPPPLPSSDCQGSSAVLATLHILQVTLAYMLMLCVMSYNTWIFLGVILGSVLGYFIGVPLLGQI